jgi:hypothetical protein
MVASQSPAGSKPKDPLGKRTYPQRDVKLLFGWAAGRCSFEHCRDTCLAPSTLLDRAAVTAVIAHIEAHSNNGPRANIGLTKSMRDRYENWILLCPQHHIIVDVQESTYTVPLLRTWKTEHEEWVEWRLTEVMPSVACPQLQVVAEAILSTPKVETQSFDLTPIVRKMEKNELSARSQRMMKTGLGMAKEVESFVQHMSVAYPQFPEALKAGFVDEYNRGIRDGLSGDALFASLKLLATGVSSDFELQCAGLGVLTYMFHKCEVFSP